MVMDSVNEVDDATCTITVFDSQAEVSDTSILTFSAKEFSAAEVRTSRFLCLITHFSHGTLFLTVAEVRIYLATHCL